MKPLVIIGVILILVGAVILGYRGFTYTKREKVVDVGPIKVTAEKRETVPLSPALGGLAIAGGIVLVLVGAKKS